MLHGNSKLLVSRLEGLSLLDGRYSELKLMNMPNGEKRGFFSLVFSAYDEINECKVALKFFDLDPNKQSKYRLLSFEREHEILMRLKGAPRCLQVVSNYSQYNLNIEIAGQDSPVSIPANYFATEWIEDDIDDCFNRQEVVGVVKKLKLFNEIVLAVGSLHSRDVFHRDLKVDNFRSRLQANKHEVVVIDLGTAARLDSQPMMSTYECPIGFLMYSAPEAFCGLAGNRSVAPLTDIFALGCMLFELFHPDDFPSAYRLVNPDFDLRFSALQARIDMRSSDDEKVAQWDIEAPKLLRGLTHVSLDDAGSSAPPAIASILTALVSGMTAPDFRDRSISFARIRQLTWAAIRVMEHSALYKRRSEQAARKRAIRVAKAEAKASRARFTPSLRVDRSV